jgi:hypothetical protein
MPRRRDTHGVLALQSIPISIRDATPLPNLSLNEGCSIPFLISFPHSLSSPPHTPPSTSLLVAWAVDSDLVYPSSHSSPSYTFTRPPPSPVPPPLPSLEHKREREKVKQTKHHHLQPFASMEHSPSPSLTGPPRVPRNESSAALSIHSDISGAHGGRTGGMSPMSVAYDDDFRYRTVSRHFPHHSQIEPWLCRSLRRTRHIAHRTNIHAVAAPLTSVGVVDDQLPLQEDHGQWLDPFRA